MTSPFPSISLIGDYITSVIRTGVALVVGVVVSWAVRHGFNIDQASATAYVTPLAFFGYYALARYLEHRWPKMGILFGIAKAPNYTPATVHVTLPPLSTFLTGGVVPGIPGTSTTGSSGTMTFDPPLSSSTTTAASGTNVLGLPNDPTPEPPADPPASPTPPAA